MNFSWSTFADLAKMFAPIIIAAVVPGGAFLGPLVGGAIGSVEEAFAAKTGAAKKAAVQTAAVSVTTAANAANGSVLLDPVQAGQQVGIGIDLIVNIINDIQKYQAAHPATPPVPVPPHP